MVFLVSGKDQYLKHHASIVIMSAEYLHHIVKLSFPMTMSWKRSKHSNRTVALIETRVFIAKINNFSRLHYDGTVTSLKLVTSNNG